MLRYVSPANLEICRLLQSDDRLEPALERLHAGWRISAVIHGDLRPDNVLVVERSSETEVLLIDWESTRRGDPAWDAGSVLRDSLHLWLIGLPTASELSADERLAGAAAPLGQLQPAHDAFWRSYVETTGLADIDQPGFLERAARYCGARLVQTAWEATSEAEELPAREVLLLQVATNMLAEPAAAVRDLFGLGGVTSEKEGER